MRLATSSNKTLEELKASYPQPQPHTLHSSNKTLEELKVKI